MSTTITIAPTTAGQLDAIARAAAAAHPLVRDAGRDARARWLRAIADELDQRADDLIAVANAETHIPPARLAGEVARTTGQLRAFVDAIEEGGYLEATIDHARPDLVPPTPDLRRLLVPLGPVAVYSASNFPFAFSVAGGDTASALAAGNPVIVKAHSGHPELSAATAAAVKDALRGAGAPDGAFDIVYGRDAGTRLVQHPAVRAAGFTGSVGGGRALFDAASGRPDPIPFYGELGSVNPVFVTPAADAARGDELAAGLAESFRISLGQLCTKPGLVFVPAGSRLAHQLARLVGADGAGELLTPSISRQFHEAISALEAHPGVRRLAGAAEQPDSAAAPVVYATGTAALDADPTLLDERFGPTTLLVEYDALEDAVAVAERLGGSLTATLHAEDDEQAPELVGRLTELAGRVLFEGWPTGVAVTAAQTHGGPWPATTSLHTSVGATAIRRFLRPVTYQSAPEHILPAELLDANPAGIPRRVDGRLEV